MKCCSRMPLPCAPPSTVVIVAVPLQVAVPLPRVAEVAADVEPYPVFVIVSAVPPAIVFVPVRATVAVAPVFPLLNAVSVQVWLVLPEIEPPDVYVPLLTPVKVLYLKCTPIADQEPKPVVAAGWLFSVFWNEAPGMAGPANG